MSDKISNPNIDAQRYYYFVTFKNESQSLDVDFLNTFKVVKIKEQNVFFSSEELIIDNIKIESKIQFFGSDKDYSVNSDGAPPYIYDVFQISIINLNITVLGFPFKSLAKSILKKLIDEHSLLKKVEFIKPKLKEIVLANNDKGYQEFIGENGSANITSLEIVGTGDIGVSSIRLDGDNPLDSSLYKDIFFGRLENNEGNVKSCTIKCEANGTEGNIMKNRANVYLDSFGNFKYYLHSHGKNIGVMSFIINLLQHNSCLETTLNNPIEKLQDDYI